MDLLTPALAFLAGAAVPTIAWWLWTRARIDEPAPAPPSRPEVVVEPPSPDPDEPPARLPRPKGVLRVSQRVVLHLAYQPRLAYGDVAPDTLTQAGMTRSLSVAQPALAKVLGRLVDGGALLEMKTHVAGQPRRLKVYQLTALGESIGRDLRLRHPRLRESSAAERPHDGRPPTPVDVRAPRPGTDDDGREASTRHPPRRAEPIVPSETGGPRPALPLRR